MEDYQDITRKNHQNKTIYIPQSVIESVFVQAQNELPNEACGLFIGRENEVIRQYPMVNIDHSPEHFSFDPSEQFLALREARKDGLRIIANYHSHPSTPARPSDEDIRLAYDPDIFYIIVSLADKAPDIKAFSIVSGVVEKVEINT
ncbi:MAG: M67 family metallopeptidase [Tannerella sp.]|jgi:proteasome lid subunit RPN8/RPN11|nr:M67 family metallopeptidase [Tannerella sp.]